VAGAGRIICNPRGNSIVHFAWGLGKVSNNIFEAYFIWKGVNIAREKGIRKITILGDSMIVIRALIKRHVVSNNAIVGILASTQALLNEFEMHCLLLIKRDNNPLANRWAKVGSSLGEGELIVNGVKVFHPIP